MDFFTNHVREIDGKRVWGHMHYGKRDPSLGWRFTDAWLGMAGVGDPGLPNGSPVDEWGIRVEDCRPVGSRVSRGGATNGPAAGRFGRILSQPGPRCVDAHRRQRSRLSAAGAVVVDADRPGRAWRCRSEGGPRRRGGAGQDDGLRGTPTHVARRRSGVADASTRRWFVAMTGSVRDKRFCTRSVVRCAK